jgi:Raf kinase inhibitor-like YbhB/YbcL family protein
MSTAITTILLEVTSSTFKENDLIPSKYSCEKENINPPLTINNIPADCKSLAIIVDDPDALGSPFVHWVMWNIDPSIKMINENSAPGIQGINGHNKNEYTGPCPKFGMQHHYHFKIYALDEMLDLPANSGKQGLEEAMKNHIIARGELIGLYNKENDDKKILN